MLLYMDSFDHYSSPGQKGWVTTQTVSTTFGISASGRNGTSALVSPGSGSGSRTATQTISATPSSFVCGFAFAASSNRTIVQFQENGTTHLDLRYDASGHIQVTRNGTVLATGTTVYGAGYHYIELKATINDTTGTYEVHIDGILELSGSGADTRNGGTGFVNQIRYTAGASDLVQIDDLYFCDLTGSVNNDFLGDVRVEVIYPNGNGNSSQLVGSDSNSVNNYQLVDETTPNSDTDYVESTSVGDKDTYAYTDLATSATGSVMGVQVLPFAKKTDAGTRTIVSVARLSSTEVDSASKTLITSYGYLPDIRETKPGGGAWSVTDVNSAEFGVKINS